MCENRYMYSLCIQITFFFKMAIIKWPSDIHKVQNPHFMAFHSTSDKYATFFLNYCQHHFLKFENHFFLHFSTFQINIELLFHGILFQNYQWCPFWISDFLLTKNIVFKNIEQIQYTTFWKNYHIHQTFCKSAN